MTDITRHVPSSTQLLAARMLMTSDLAGRMTNVCISNVPGPAIPMYMNGAKNISAMGLGPLADRMGLFIAVTSYDGKMTFNVTSCRRTLPDIEFFIECIVEGFNELKQLAQTSERADKRKKASNKSVKNKTVSKKKATTKPPVMPSNRKKRKKKPSSAVAKKPSVKKVSAKK